MDLCDNLIKLRLMLASYSEGYDVVEANKSTPLSTRIKILYALKDKDMTPNEFIEEICIAKSNLANLLKSLISDGVVIGYKNADNSRNVNYRLTQKGLDELNNYKREMYSKIRLKYSGDDVELAKRLHDVIQLLKGGNND